MIPALHLLEDFVLKKERKEALAGNMATGPGWGSGGCGAHTLCVLGQAGRGRDWGGYKPRTGILTAPYEI